MYDFRDPSICHGGTCNNCGNHVADNEQMLFAHGRMDVCADCLDLLIAEEEAEAEEEA